MDTTLELTEIGSDSDPNKVIRLKGPLVISNLFDFQTKVRACKSQNLIIDMTEVPYSDSAGIGVLMGAYISREKVGHKLLLVGVNQRVRSVLQVTQVERFFHFADTMPDLSTGA
ncbi:MAG TPA: STAS domain-containing protein [Candidatus Koribacter sp.]|jgi:anti-sigma B factor antagonist